MSKASVRITLLATIVLSASLATVGISSCGGHKLDGTYSNPSGMMTIQFKEGKATLTMGPMSSPPVPYEIKGDKVTIHAGEPVGDAVMTINQDGSLQSDVGVLTKTK